MKRAYILILVWIACCTFLPHLAYASEYTDLSIEELEALRDEKYYELSLINQEIINKLESGKSANSIERVSTIIELFPDEDFATLVRDELKKTSIQDSVTQEELDTITIIKAGSFENYSIKELTGISHLRNTKSITVKSKSKKILSEELLQLPHLETLIIVNYACESLPSWFSQLITLKRLEFYDPKLTELPNDIGNLLNLESLILEGASNLYTLPESLSKITCLKTISLWYTQIEDKVK